MVELGGFEPATNSIPERVPAIPCEIGVNWSNLGADKMRTRVQSRWELGGVSAGGYLTQDAGIR